MIEFSDAQIGQFHDDGFVVVERLIDADTVARAAARSLVADCVSSAARFHPTAISAIYSRYKRHGDDTMDESFFPILWTADGYRTPFLDDR